MIYWRDYFLRKKNEETFKYKHEIEKLSVKDKNKMYKIMEAFFEEY